MSKTPTPDNLFKEWLKMYDVPPNAIDRCRFTGHQMKEFAKTYANSLLNQQIGWISIDILPKKENESDKYTNLICGGIDWVRNDCVFCHEDSNYYSNFDTTHGYPLENVTHYHMGFKPPKQQKL